MCRTTGQSIRTGIPTRDLWNCQKNAKTTAIMRRGWRSSMSLAFRSRTFFRSIWYNHDGRSMAKNFNVLWVGKVLN